MAPSAAIETEAVTDTSTITVLNPLAAPLKINELYGRRKTPLKSQWGVAAVSNSELFKLRPQEGKPKAKNWDYRLSQEALSRKGNSLKQAAKFLATPGLISLGGGIPTSEYFPFDSLMLKVPRVGHFSEAEAHASGMILESGKHDLLEDKSILDIATAFNYGQGTGTAQLLRWVTEHTELVHDPPYQDWACTLTVGSTSALDMAFRMFTEKGDYVLSEEYTFATAVETAAPMGVKVAGVKMDAQGLLPDSMDEILTHWDPVSRGARKPTVLYTVPTGQNPTGATQGHARRRAIYAVAQKHDLYILEDEPYYFLQMDPYTGPDAPPAPTPTTHEEFLKNLVPSLLSMDVDGRVLRMDSFSKVISPGSRVGWITASEPIVRKYYMHADVSTQGPSGMSQLLLFKLLDEGWGHPGYLDWLMHIRAEYTKRRDVILAACETHLPKEVVSWVPPMAGMFHWLQVKYEKHPRYPAKSITELEDEIFMRNVGNGVLMMKGSWFYASSEERHDTLFFRATFAAAPFDRIQEAIRRFGKTLRESFGLEMLEDGEDGVVSNGVGGKENKPLGHHVTNGHTGKAV
ncbi:Aromatic/aminoadipate aminotransferase 1 [Coniosporium tulheliwenetii]|uniref:Aromatic/aminoadipate aminotransferase 1 n=1 Tax=Coniosporium tulheliwenetii TaxID=3383036 RepID=A0ACC2ZL91_9PEZI|nr:Aromatic/aminoadipate aminotransferase 1 [Cladosporium sp. JES 115]